MPLTASGKLDRRALPVPGAARPDLERPFVPPRTPAEEALAMAWGLALDLDEVGIDDDFFALGGDSIKSLRVLGEARRLGLELALPDLFDHPSIRGLARVVRTAGAERATAPFELIGDADRRRLPAGAEDAYPLTLLQAGMVFESSRATASAVYHDVYTVRLAARFDRGALAEALAALAARHGVLRTSFRLTEFSEPLQVVHAVAAPPLAVADLRALPENAAAAAVRRWVAAEARRHFPWERPPLARVQVHLLAGGSFQFSLSFHHAILDGWSIATLATELFADYRARLGGRAPAVEPPAAAFRDYVALERAALASEASREHWRRALAGAGRTRLPRLGGARDRRSRVRPMPIAIGGEAVEAGLRRTARAAGVPLKSVLLAVHLRVLATAAGAGEAVTGLVVSGRPESDGGDRVLGLFLNTLPLRLAVAGGASWLDLARAAFSAERASLPHRRFPLAEIQRLHGGDELFETAFNFVDFHVYQRLAGGDEAGGDDGERGEGLELLEGDFYEATHFALLANFGLTPEGRRLHGEVKYDASVLGEAQAAAVAGWYGRALASAAAEPEARVGGVELLSEAERARLAGWSAMRLPATAEPAAGASGVERLSEVERARLAGPAPRLSAAVPTGARPATTVIDRLWSVAAAAPDAVAVSSGGAQVSYGELARRAEALARRLAALGAAGPGAVVGLCLERSIELVAAVIGVLRAGAVYLPLDPAQPAARQALVLGDARPAVVVADAAGRGPVAEALAAAGVEAVVLGAAEALRPAAGAASPLPPPSPGDPAYVLYTSGSTGRPKGVRVGHREVARLLTSTSGWFDFGPRDVWTLFHSYTFDFSVWELWGALALGGRLAVVPRETARTPERFHDLLAAERATVLNQTPSAFGALIAAEGARAGSAAGSAAGGDLAALRWVVFGGEALRAAELAPWFARRAGGGPRLVNMYGITETTVHVTYREVTASDAASGSGSRIGVPIPDLSLWVLDRWGRPAPVGVAGEIAVGGAGVSGGYPGRPALTAARFVPDPFSREPGARLYRSGDLGRWVPAGAVEAGEVEYLGRIDHQVQVRGFRVELGEIEAALGRCPGVAEAVVVARDDGAGPGGELRLVAYLVPAPGAAVPDAGTLRAALAAKLPDYMLPAAWVALERLPLTANGKVDRAALPDPDEGGRLAAARPYRVPRTPVEETLAAIWAEVLRAPRVGLDDGFFELGGDSILSIRLVGLAAERGLAVSVEQLFAHPTVRELAPRLGRADAIAPSAPWSLVSAEDRERLPADAEDAYPLTRLQTGMFFHSQYRPGTAVYHDLLSLSVRAPFDRRRLAAALAELAARHPVLRTSFDGGRYGQALQIVHRRAAVLLAVADLTALAPPARAAALRAWIEAERRRDFDWERAPLLRVQVHRLDDESFRLSLSFHHAILDGWSVAVLLAELFRRYRGEPLEPPPALSFRDFAAAELAALGSEASREHWRRALAGAGRTVLPRLGAPAGLAAAAGVRVLPVEVGSETAAGLQRLAARLALPLKSVLLAVHLRVLAAAAGAAEVLTGLVSSGRPEGEGGDRVLGLFLNTLPLRLAVPGGASWLDLARAAFAAERESLPHRRFPLAEIQRLHGGDDLFETAFNFVHFHVYREVDAGEGVEVLGGELLEETHFTLLANFGVDPGDGRLTLEVKYDAAALGEAQAESIAGWYGRALASAAAAPEARVGGVELLSEAERARLAGWSAMRPQGAGESTRPMATVIDRLWSAAAASPDAVAVTSGGAQVSYGELTRRAEALARRLAVLGAAGPGAVVGLCLERSIELVAAIAGVLRAGAAYLPLDPAQPAERQALVLGDARPAVVVADAAGRGPVAEALAAAGVEAVVLGVSEALRPMNGAAPALLPPPSPGDPAYVLYTSGSTGRPKGVRVGHREVARLLTSTSGWFDFGASDVWTLFHSYTFDFSVWELWGALALGGRLVVVPRETARTPERFHDLLAAERATVLNQTPSAFGALIAAEGARAGSGAGSAAGGDLAALRWVVFGGEALRAAELAPWFARRAGGGPRLVNMYGITETTVHVTYREVTAADAASGSGSRIGVPIPDLSLWVLDRWGLPAPVGVAGEIAVGGAGVSGGYPGRPALTAARFVPDPFSREPGARLYRSGDLGRWVPAEEGAGEVEYLGRIDHQVQVRGFRVELGEIEAALGRCPGVAEAVVIARDDGAGPGGELRLVAYLVPAPGEAVPDAGTLRAALAAKLPDYMLPAAWVALERLPLTANGKVDRAALPDPDEGGRLAAARPYRAPRTPVEETLAAIWAEVLRAPRVGLDDDLFELGGHSLLAVRIVARIRAELGVELPLAALYEATTVEALSLAVLEAQLAAGPGVGPGMDDLLAEIEGLSGEELAAGIGAAGEEGGR